MPGVRACRSACASGRVASSLMARYVADYPWEDPHLPLFGPPNVDRFKARGDVLELIKALDYPKHWRVRRDAAEALGEIGDPDAVEPLIGVLRDDNPSVRMSAAEALGQIGDVRAVEHLLAALKSPAVEVRKSAAEALGQIGDVRAVEPLIAAMKEASWSVRRAAAEALGRIGDPDATDALTAALEDHDSNVRRAATESLEAIASQPLRPRSGIPAGRAAPLVRAQRTRRLR